MIKVLISPTENKLSEQLADDAVTSPIPEGKGADILLYTPQGLIGIQRKAVPHDFLSSVEDGRMARSTSLLSQNCTFRLLLCEGRFRFYPDGRLDLGPRIISRYNRSHINGMLYDIKYVKGVDVDYTDDVRDTAFYIRSLANFFSRERHLGLYARPSMKGTWGAPTTKDLYLWMLQSFPGIGVTLADNILRQFGGEIPLRWSCTLEDLKGVPKIGKKRAEELWGSLGHESQPETKSIFDEIREQLKGPR